MEFSMTVKALIKTGILATLGLVLATAAQAGMYKWTDEEGNVHYSQKPPRGKQYEKLKVQKGPPPGTQTKSPSYSTPSISEDAGSKAVEEEVAKNEEIRKKNCEAAKKNLRVFQIYNRVKGEDGKIRVVTKQEREEKIQKSKDAIREFCK